MKGREDQPGPGSCLLLQLLQLLLRFLLLGLLRSLLPPRRCPAAAAVAIFLSFSASSWLLVFGDDAFLTRGLTNLGSFQAKAKTSLWSGRPFLAELRNN